MKTILLIMFWGIESFGQKVDSSSFSNFFNLTFGNKFINRKAGNSNGKIDFFEHILEEDNQQIDIQTRKILKNRNAFTFTLILYSDMELRNFEIFYSKLKSKNFGYFAGFKTYGYYFSNYSLVNMNNEFTNYTIKDSNIKYGYVNQPAVNIGPMFYFKNKHFTVESKINLSLGYLGNFNESSFLTSINTFEIVKIEVKNQKSTFISIIPDLSISSFPLKFKNSKIGIIAQGNYQNVKRSFDYERTIKRWTLDNSVKENITGNKQHFKNIELNFGINWQFK